MMASLIGTVLEPICRDDVRKQAVIFQTSRYTCKTVSYYTRVPEKLKAVLLQASKYVAS